ncbi:MAG: hypothetical protein ACR2KH_02540 [Sphingomicrobium sp.]
MLKKLLFAGGMAYLWRKFRGGSRMSGNDSLISSRRGGLRL